MYDEDNNYVPEFLEGEDGQEYFEFAGHDLEDGSWSGGFRDPLREDFLRPDYVDFEFEDDNESFDDTLDDDDEEAEDEVEERAWERSGGLQWTEPARPAVPPSPAHISTFPRPIHRAEFRASAPTSNWKRLLGWACIVFGIVTIPIPGAVVVDVGILALGVWLVRSSKADAH